MERAPGPVFLERKSYRRRRLTDALRLLAFLGIVLWLIPGFWPTEASGTHAAVPMSHGLFYVFGAWLCLIVLAALLAFMTRGQDELSETSPDGAVQDE